jgi:hypothetical protein
VVTAFTLGHSVTLLLGAFGTVRLPEQPVEFAIALSILFSAAHAWRPISRAAKRGWHSASGWCTGWRLPRPSASCN